MFRSSHWIQLKADMQESASEFYYPDKPKPDSWWLLKSGTGRNGMERFRLLKYGTHGTEQATGTAQCAHFHGVEKIRHYIYNFYWRSNDDRESFDCEESANNYRCD